MRSPSIRCVVVVSILMWSAPARAGDYGEIEVKGPRRVRIILDDEYKGVITQADGAITLTHVRAGVHVLRATWAGFMPQEVRVTVKAGETLTYKLRRFLLPGEKREPDPADPDPGAKPTPDAAPSNEPAPEPQATEGSRALAEGDGAFAQRVLSKPPEDATQIRFRAGVDDALAWLAAHQSPDGKWEAAGFNGWCDGKPLGEESRRAAGLGKPLYDSGVTGLALCAFLGAGYTQRGKHPYAKIVERGLRYLESIQRKDGCFGALEDDGHTYCHATCALAMVEAFGMTGSPWCGASAQRALDFIEALRNPYFAWRYGIRPGDCDTSVSGLMTLVLKSAEITNAYVLALGKKAPLAIHEDAYSGMKAWLEKVTDPKTGRVGYVQRGQGPGRRQEVVDRFPAKFSEATTAMGTLARMAMGVDPGTKFVRLGVRLCGRCLPKWNEKGGTIDMFYWYWGTMLMVQVGGGPWRRWEKAIVRAIADTQRTDGDSCTAKGSWDPSGPWGVDGGRVYATALMAMCLEVHTRYARYVAER